MMLQSVLRHEVMRRLPKLLLVTFGLAIFISNLTLYFRSEFEPGSAILEWMPVGFQVFIYLSACLVLMVPEAGRRCRQWELSLPVPGKFWWQSHFYSLLLAGICLMLLYVIFPLLLLVVDNPSEVRIFQNAGSSMAKTLLNMWGIPLLFYIMTLDLVALWRPASAMPGQEKGWNKRVAILVISTTILLVITSRLGLTGVLLVLLAGLALQLRRIKVPDTLSLPSVQAVANEETIWPSSSPASGNPFLLHFTVIRLLFKWPTNWLILIPFIGFFGMLLGGYNPISDEPEALRFSNLFMCIYILAAGGGHFTEKLHLLDFLPVARRTMLSWLVWPVVITLALGYGFGQNQAAKSKASTEPLSFVNEDSGYGLKVPARCFRLIRSAEAPFVTSPSGETHQADSVVAVKGLPWLFYKPYSTPKGASLDYVAWQMSRAIENVFGEQVSPQEISDQYLEIDSQGHVKSLSRGLNLKADHPQWSEVKGGTVFPVLFGFVTVFFLLVLSLHFRMLRRQASFKKGRITFWILLGALMALHLANLVTYITGLTDDWIVRGIILGGIQRWSEFGNGFGWIVYGGVLVAIASSWLLALGQFKQIESPAKEDGC
ncbi:MAG: hypothetical protein GY780_12090 [bacterium]|nr:hypothetical protein [bacterium]